MQGAGGSYPTRAAALNVAQLFAFLQEPGRQAESAFCTDRVPCDARRSTSPHTLPQPNPFNSYDVSREAPSTSTPKRLSHGDRSGRATWACASCIPRPGADRAIGAGVAVDADHRQSTESYNVQYCAGRHSRRMPRTHLPCPRPNFSYWLVPKQLQLRAAGGETHSRPDLNQLAPNATNKAINGTPDL